MKSNLLKVGTLFAALAIPSLALADGAPKEEKKGDKKEEKSGDKKEEKKDPKAK